MMSPTRWLSLSCHDAYLAAEGPRPPKRGVQELGVASDSGRVAQAVGDTHELKLRKLRTS